MTLRLPETASPATRAIAEALEERGELQPDKNASYAERIAFKEAGGTLTSGFARKRADQLDELVRKEGRGLLFAPFALIFSSINLFNSETGIVPEWLWAFLLVAAIAAGAWGGIRWYRRKETARLYDLLATALAQDETRADKEVTQAKALPPGEPLVTLPEDSAEPDRAPFTRGVRQRTVR